MVDLGDQWYLETELQMFHQHTLRVDYLLECLYWFTDRIY